MASNVRGVYAVLGSDYSLPAPADAQSHLMNAYQMEATLCGTFIGLADYAHVGSHDMFRRECRRQRSTVCHENLRLHMASNVRGVYAVLGR
jgi:hypothetical protein